MSIVIVLITLVSLILSSVPIESSAVTKSIVDLSHPLNSETLHWITARPFELKVVQNGTTRRGDYNIWVQSDEVYMASHTGTHLDAPCHFARGQWSVSDIPLDNLIDRPIAVIDVVEQSVATRDYEASVEDIKRFEEDNGQIPDRGVVLIKTGWARFWPNKLEYFGTETSDPSLVHFPGIHPDASQWLVEHRNIVGIGIDSPSVDHGQSKGYKTHQIFANKNIYNLENIAKTIHKLPAIGAKLTLLPLKIEGASGTPVTVIAYIDSEADSVTSISTKCLHSVSLLTLTFATLRYITF